LRVRRREEVDVGTARILFKSWLHECYGSRYSEPGYVPVPHHLIEETDVVVGSYWAPQWPMWRAVNAVLWRRRQIPRIKTSPGHGAARP